MRTNESDMYFKTSGLAKEGKGLLLLCRKSIYMGIREWKIGIILPLNFELFLDSEHAYSV